jgi:hypothetical protein
MSRDMVWHELFDRMQNNQCPICDLIHNRTLRSMDGFLYESVNDVSTRKNISNSYGFCNSHAYMLMEMGDPLAHALIYSDLLKQAIDNMSGISLKQNNLYQSHNECLFCKQAKESEEIYIKAFTDYFIDIEFREKYVSEGMLCLPHLELIKKNKSFEVNKIINISLEKYRSLVVNLMEIKRKSDYRFSSEIWTEQEKAAWKKAVNVINALKGIRK